MHQHVPVNQCTYTSMYQYVPAWANIYSTSMYQHTPVFSISVCTRMYLYITNIHQYTSVCTSVYLHIAYTGTYYTVYTSIYQCSTACTNKYQCASVCTCHCLHHRIPVYTSTHHDMPVQKYVGCAEWNTSSFISRQGPFRLSALYRWATGLTWFNIRITLQPHVYSESIRP